MINQMYKSFLGITLIFFCIITKGNFSSAKSFLQQTSFSEADNNNNNNNNYIPTNYDNSNNSQEQCAITGINHELCIIKEDFDNITHHGPFRNFYTCYAKAICSYQGGNCKWLQTDEYNNCMKNYTNSNNNYNIALITINPNII